MSTNIEWVRNPDGTKGETWNPVTGCTKISPGCRHCYADRMAHRLQVMGQPRYRKGFELTLQPDVLERPLRWKESKLVFVNSMSDLFHHDVPDDYIRQTFEIMEEADWHVFQILTKRVERLARLAPYLTWPHNVWMGVSVETQDSELLISPETKMAPLFHFGEV